MTKKAGGKNRVCLPCHKKYPSKFTNDPKSFNVTSVCSDCGGDLTEITDSIPVPKKKDAKGWRELVRAVENEDFSAYPGCRSTDAPDSDAARQAKIETNMHLRRNRERARNELGLYHKNSPALVEALLEAQKESNTKEATLAVFERFDVKDAKRRFRLAHCVSQASFWGYKLSNNKSSRGTYLDVY